MTEMNKEYGTALFMLAKELEKENEYAVALECVEEVFSGNAEYIDFLASPSIPMEERLSAIEAAFGESVPENIVSFLQLLCEKGRIRGFDKSVEEYKSLLDAQNHVSVAYVKSVVELTEEQKENLKNKLEIKTGNSVILECSTDQSLMGGIVVEIDGQLMDASLKTRLCEVKDVISQ